MMDMAVFLLLNTNKVLQGRYLQSSVRMFQRRNKLMNLATCSIGGPQ